MKVYQAIASKIEAMRNCDKSGNYEWFNRHHDSILAIVEEYLPSGSGFDCGTAIDALALVDSAKDSLRFTVYFHHMADSGMYDGWTAHSIIVTPSLAHGFHLRVTGKNKNDVKEYIADIFNIALSADCRESVA